MATTYPDYSNASTFVEDANFVDIIYADNVPTLSSEDKEAQHIQYDALRKYISETSKSGVLSKANYTIDTVAKTLTFASMFSAVVEGYVVKIPPVSIAIGNMPSSGTRTDIVFLEVFLKEVTKDSVVKKYGFENGSETVSNKIVSSLIGGETSKRTQLCSRLRYVQNSSSMTDAVVLAQGPNVSPQTGNGFTKGDDGSFYYNAFVNSVTGILYAIPIMTITFDVSTYEVADLRMLVSEQKEVLWTIRTTPVDNHWQSVCYGNGMFVAVSNSGTGNRVMTSPDGINWTIRTTPVDNNWRSVCYGLSLIHI